MNKYILHDRMEDKPVAIIETNMDWDKVQAFINQAIEWNNEEELFEGWTLSEVVDYLLEEDNEFEMDIIFLDDFDSIYC